MNQFKIDVYFRNVSSKDIELNKDITGIYADYVDRPTIIYKDACEFIIKDETVVNTLKLILSGETTPLVRCVGHFEHRAMVIDSVSIIEGGDEEDGSDE